MLRGAGLVFFAYIGFDAVSTAAQEAKNPQRDMPIGILGSLVVCTLLYVVVSAVLTGMVSYTELNVPAPMALAMQRTGAPDWLRISIDVGAVLGLASVVLVQMLGQSRVFYAMSRDGLIGGWFSKVHPKFRTPYLSTIFTGFAVVAGLGPAAAADPRAAGEHRHAAGVRAGVRRRDHPADRSARTWSGRSRCRSCRWCRSSACSAAWA